MKKIKALVIILAVVFVMSGAVCAWGDSVTVDFRLSNLSLILDGDTTQGWNNGIYSGSGIWDTRLTPSSYYPEGVDPAIIESICQGDSVPGVYYGSSQELTATFNVSQSGWYEVVIKGEASCTWTPDDFLSTHWLIWDNRIDFLVNWNNNFRLMTFHHVGDGNIVYYDMWYVDAGTTGGIVSVGIDPILWYRVQTPLPSSIFLSGAVILGGVGWRFKGKLRGR